MHIIISSKNPVKIEATRAGFASMFPDQEITTEGISVSSGVKEQPLSSKEGLNGATNRAQNAAKSSIAGDFFVGLEGGVEDKEGKMHSFAWIVICDKNGKFGFGKTGEFILPSKVRELILGGMELGHADDLVFSKTNSKQENGAVGILTENAIDRAEFYKQAVIFALIPFKNPTLY
jgi:inosine/xanthosine triphosphatase